MKNIKKSLGFEETPTNMNHYFLKMVERYPDKIALHYPRPNSIDKIEYKSLTFKQYLNESLHYANGLHQAGFKPGDRIIILFPVCLEIYYIICACFYLGIVPVFIDHSMDKDTVVKALKQANAEGMISTKALLKYRVFLPFLWKLKCYTYKEKILSAKHLSELYHPEIYSRKECQRKLSDHTLISFTTGSTGNPKGSNRNLEILTNQKLIGQYYWPEIEDEVDMPVFPMVVLQNLGCGVTTCLAAYDFSDLDNMKPEIIYSQLVDMKVTRFSSPPSFINKLLDYMKVNNLELPHLKRIIIGGAPTSKAIAQKLMDQMPGCSSQIVYGSTEAEPISHTAVEEFVQANGDGYLVGKTIGVLNLKMLAIDFKVTDKLEDKLIPADSQKWGEIILSGPHVIKEYIDGHPANIETKIKDDQGNIWHRTGDIGRFDSNEQLWLLGRLNDLIQVNGELSPCYHFEDRINLLSEIEVCALINKDKSLFCCIKGKKTQQLVEILEKLNLEAEIVIIEIMPYDKRHHSKIDRKKLLAQLY